jgi:hypothetical protein
MTNKLFVEYGRIYFFLIPNMYIVHVHLFPYLINRIFYIIKFWNMTSCSSLSTKYSLRREPKISDICRCALQ